jgi:hypothetical protein
VNWSIATRSRIASSPSSIVLFDFFFMQSSLSLFFQKKRSTSERISDAYGIRNQ